MKSRLVKTLCLACLLLTAGMVRAETASGDPAAIVAALEQRWIESERANNPDLVAELFADTATFSSSDGRVDSKAEFIAREKLTKYTSADYAELKVRVYGDTAVVTAIFRCTGTSATGKAMSVNDRVTDTWVKMPGAGWQLVANHQSPIGQQ